jgi:hypothetical protein
MRRWIAAALLVAAPTAAPAQPGAVVVQLNGGVLGFPRAGVDPGAAYGVNVGLEPLGALKLELGYQGAAYTERAPVPEAQDVVALENGGYAALKLAPLGGTVEPYALAGLGLSHINAIDPPEDAGLLQDDTVAKVPVGLGVDLEMGIFAVGIRGAWSFLFANQNALRTDAPRGADQLSGTLHIGAAF